MPPYPKLRAPTPKVDTGAIKANVFKLHAAGASDADIDEYINGALGKADASPADFSGVSGGGSTSVKPDYSTARGAASAAIQGAALGFGDEIGGGLNAVFGSGGTMGERYAKGRDQVRGIDKQFANEHPVASPLLNVAGAVAPSVLVGGASLPRVTGGIIKRIGAGAAEGAGIGAIAGAGQAEGGAQKRLTGAGVGAAAGSVVGAVVPAAGAALGALRTIAAPATEAMAAKQSTRLINAALERDSKTPADLITAGADFAGKPAVVADLGGENMHGLTRYAANVPGAGKQNIPETLIGRHLSQAQRIGSDLEAATGNQRQNVHDVVEHLIANRQNNAKPLYQAAYARGRIDDPAVVEDFQALQQLPEFKAAMKRGRRIGAVEGVNVPTDVPTVQGIDYMKRGLDALIEARSSGANAISRTEGRVLRNRLSGFLGKVDTAIPEYGQARQQFAGDSQLMDAFQVGQQFGKTDSRTIAKITSRMTDGEKELYRVGALDNIRQTMDKTKDSADLVKRLFATPESRAQLKEMIGDDAKYAKLEKSFEQESKMARTKDVATVGSRTAPMLMEMADAAGNALETGKNLATGNIGGLVGQAGRAMLGARAKGIQGKVADALSSKLLVQPGTPEFDRLISELEAGHAALNTSATRAAVARRSLSATAASGVNR